MCLQSTFTNMNIAWIFSFASLNLLYIHKWCLNYKKTWMPLKYKDSCLIFQWFFPPLMFQSVCLKHCTKLFADQLDKTFRKDDFMKIKDKLIGIFRPLFLIKEKERCFVIKWNMIDYLNIMNLFPPERVGTKPLSKVSENKNTVLPDLRIRCTVKRHNDSVSKFNLI